LIISRIREDIDITKAKIVIIDNITYLTTHSAEDSQVALTLMRLLKELKTEKNLSILVLAHTPKKTSSFGITIQDLAGSKHLSNFADGVFALGYSTKDTGLRYFIQVKPSRSGELKYDKENVLVVKSRKRIIF
jgi:KaiC/GvpD/RAD55 family RecA-like ATPase